MLFCVGKVTVRKWKVTLLDIFPRISQDKGENIGQVVRNLMSLDEWTSKTLHLYRTHRELLHIRSTGI